MITLDLTDWLSLEIYRVLLVFVRITAAFLLMPGFGEPTVPARIRILVGLAIAAAVSPAIVAMPTAVPNVWGILLGVAAEGPNGPANYQARKGVIICTGGHSSNVTFIGPP